MIHFQRVHELWSAHGMVSRLAFHTLNEQRSVSTSALAGNHDSKILNGHKCICLWVVGNWAFR